MNCAKFEKLSIIAKRSGMLKKQILALTATGGVHSLMTMMLKG